MSSHAHVIPRIVELWVPVNEPSPIETQIKDAIRSRQTGPLQSGGEVDFWFSLDWDPYPCFANNATDTEAPLNHAYTLTGYGTNVQAATAIEYMTQTWRSRGTALFNYLAQNLRINVRRPEFILFNQLFLSAPNESMIIIAVMAERIGEKMITVRVTAQPNMVAEAASQLAWFCGAFRKSDKLAFCRPVIEDLTLEVREGSPPAQLRLRGDCKIGYRDVPFERHRHPMTCWTSLLPDDFPGEPRPVIISGYEIRTQPDYMYSRAHGDFSAAPTAGLEIAWDLLMGFLGGTAQPPRPRDLSSSPIVLRGRNFILSSVVLKKGYIYWHLIPDNLQARNYLGHDAANPPQTKHVSPDFDIQELETKCRHFVGGQCGVLKSFVIDGKSVKKLHCRVTIW